MKYSLYLEQEYFLASLSWNLSSQNINGINYDKEHLKRIHDELLTTKEEVEEKEILDVHNSVDALMESYKKMIQEKIDGFD